MPFPTKRNPSSLLLEQCRVVGNTRGAVAIEAAQLFIVILLFLTSGAVSMAAARVSQTIIRAHHIAKTVAVAEWDARLLTPPAGGAAVGSIAHLVAVVGEVETAMQKQAQPVLDHGCGVDGGMTEIANRAAITASGGRTTLGWQENTGTGVLNRDYTRWSNFPVLSITTGCDVTLRSVAGLPLPGRWEWDIEITSFVAVECYRSVADGLRLCG